MSDPLVITVEREISAPADRIFDVLADPARHREIDGSDTLRDTAVEAPSRLSLGATFQTSMKAMGLSYKVVNTVVAFEEDRLIAWHHKNKVVWRYELEPTETGTRVRETWDTSLQRNPVILLIFKATRAPSHTGPNMTSTLERLAAVVEVPDRPDLAKD